jgi:hypothetical protein
MFDRSRKCCPTLAPWISGMFKCHLTKCWRGRDDGSLTDELLRRPASHVSMILDSPFVLRPCGQMNSAVPIPSTNK